MAVFQQKKSNKTTLDDTIPLTCSIEQAHNTKDHTEYIIRVQRGPVADTSWTVSKRYSDFDALDVALKPTGIFLPLPPKKVFGKMDREFVAERQQGLQNYLDVLLSNTILASSLLVKRFLDPSSYDFNLKENALQQISMFFRAENKWEVIEPLPDIGWRVRKQYFIIKNKQEPKDRYVLSWNTFGPDKFLDDKDLEYCMKLLSSFQHPHLCPLEFSTSNDVSGIAIRPYCERGTLRDLLCKVAKPRTTYFKKYCCPKQSVCCQIHEIKLFSRQILDTLKYLHDKGFAYGHLHAGNVVIDQVRSRVLLLDTENWLLGLPSCYRPYFTQFKKINTLEAIDVYSFGQLLYEMCAGEPLNAATYNSLPGGYPADLRSVLDCILTTEACKNGMPTIADLLQHPFFNELVLPPTEKPQIKIPSKIKETLRQAKEKMEKRLKEEQKLIHQFKRISRAQAHLMSDEEKKKRRKSKKKQMMENGGDEAVSNGTLAATEVTPSASTPTVPTGAPVPPPPPPPAPAPLNDTASTPAPPSEDSGRHALLGSIQNFSKSGLKKATTVDKSGPRI